MRNVLLTTATAVAITLSGCALNHRPQTQAEAQRSAGIKALLDDINAKSAARRAEREHHRQHNRTLYCSPNGNGMICR